MNELLSDIRHPSAKAVGLRVTKNPPCQARGWTGCSPRRRGKLPVIEHPTPRGAAPDCVCLVDSYVLLAQRLRIRRASLQRGSREISPVIGGFLRRASNQVGAGPEQPVPAFPVPAKSVKPSERRPISRNPSERWRRSAGRRQEPALGTPCEGSRNACRVARQPPKHQ